MNYKGRVTGRRARVNIQGGGLNPEVSECWITWDANSHVISRFVKVVCRLSINNPT
jgi:hypothetical protein